VRRLAAGTHRAAWKIVRDGGGGHLLGGAVALDLRDERGEPPLLPRALGLHLPRRKGWVVVFVASYFSSTDVSMSFVQLAITPPAVSQDDQPTYKPDNQRHC
jgi:hypothetical protein